MNDTVIAVPKFEFVEMTDVIFDIDCGAVPENYPFVLWAEITRCLPWLNDEKDAGFIPLRGSVSESLLLLSRRTKLVLRVPAVLRDKAEQLGGQKLNIDGNVLTVGKCKERVLQPTTTLHAHLVESNLGEIEFLADMKSKLNAMNISCNLICDKQRQIKGSSQTIRGFGLVIHDLKPHSSVLLQSVGLGGARHYGCGMFVPFKAISGLD